MAVFEKINYSLLLLIRTNMPRLLIMDHVDGIFDHLENPQTNHEEYLRVTALTKSSVDIGTMVGFKPSRLELELILIEHKDSYPHVCSIYCVDHIKQKILYVNTVEEIDLNLSSIGHDNKPVAQFFVWRDLITDAREDTRGLVQAVFFRYLLSKYKVLISDMEQTRSGMMMWKRFMYMALDSDAYKVYTVDTNKGNFRELVGPDDLINVSKWLWGHETFYINRKVLIAT